MNKSQREATPSVVPRDSVATPAQVLKALEITPEQMEEIRREQALILYRSRARLTPAERRRGLGVELENHHRITKDPDGLAEALALQGKYTVAAQTAVSPVLKAELKERAKAVSMDDDDCACDPFQEIGQFNLPTQYIESYGYSEKHDSEMPFVRCTLCGVLNAMPAPRHLQEQREMRNSQAVDKDRLDFFKK